MEPFKTHRGTFVCLDRASIDTDAIMPARYLKRIERTGYGEFLFEDLRKKDGQPDPDFPLHRPAARGGNGAGGAPELRDRLQPRARGLGDCAGGVPGGGGAINPFNGIIVS